jgi:hypothetical protein
MKRAPWLLGLVAGVLLGAAVAAGLLLPGRLASWLERGPDPQTIATSSLRAVQRQAKLTVFAARFTAVVSSEQTRLGGVLAAKKTLIVPGTVRYVLDWDRVTPASLRWDAAAKTLFVTVPTPAIEGPDIDLPAIREYKEGAVLFALTDAENALDTANRERVMTSLRQEAAAPVLTDMARKAAALAVERTFALPLAAAGVDAKVVVTVAG